MKNQTARDEISSIELQQLVVATLEDLKAIDIQNLDVTGFSPLTDSIVIASGSSSRHVKSMADKLVTKAKSFGVRPLGIEGQQQGEWVLVDLNDVIVHLMLPQTRAFYNLEKLWEASAGQRNSISVPA